MRSSVLSIATFTLLCLGVGGCPEDEATGLAETGGEAGDADDTLRADSSPDTAPGEIEADSTADATSEVVAETVAADVATEGDTTVATEVEDTSDNETRTTPLDAVGEVDAISVEGPVTCSAPYCIDSGPTDLASCGIRATPPAIAAPVVRFRFESPTRAASSGTALDLGVVHNATAGAGAVGDAFAFNGGQRLRWSRAKAPIPDRFTLAAWVRPDSDAASATLVDDPRSHVTLRLDAGLLALDVGAATFTTATADRSRDYRTMPRVVGGRWSHVAAVFDGRVVSLYVNGRPRWRRPVPAGFEYSSPTLAPVDAKVAIGGRDDGSAGFAGRLDEVMLFDVALTEAELGRATLTTAQWRFEDGNATELGPNALSTRGGSPATVTTTCAPIGHGWARSASTAKLAPTDTKLAVDMRAQLTLSAWVRPEAPLPTGTDAAFIARIPGKASLAIVGDRYRLTLANPGGPTMAVESRDPVVPGMWTRVVGVFDGQQASLYVNRGPDPDPRTRDERLGAEDETNQVVDFRHIGGGLDKVRRTTFTELAAATGDLEIGANFNGALDEVHILPVALRQDEVRDQHALVARWSASDIVAPDGEARLQYIDQGPLGIDFAAGPRATDEVIGATDEVIQDREYPCLDLQAGQELELAGPDHDLVPGVPTAAWSCPHRRTPESVEVPLMLRAPFTIVARVRVPDLGTIAPTSGDTAEPGYVWFGDPEQRIVRPNGEGMIYGTAGEGPALAITTSGNLALLLDDGYAAGVPDPKPGWHTVVAVVDHDEAAVYVDSVPGDRTLDLAAAPTSRQQLFDVGLDVIRLRSQLPHTAATGLADQLRVEEIAIYADAWHETQVARLAADSTEFWTLDRDYNPPRPVGLGDPNAHIQIRNDLDVMPVDCDALADADFVFSPSDGAGTIAWDRFPCFDLPAGLDVVYPGPTVADRAPLEHGFTHVAAGATTGNLWNRLSATERVLDWYAVAPLEKNGVIEYTNPSGDESTTLYVMNPWTRHQSPWFVHLDDHRDKWDAKWGAEMPEAAMIVQDIESRLGCRGMLSLQNANATPFQYHYHTFNRECVVELADYPSTLASPPAVCATDIGTGIQPYDCGHQTDCAECWAAEVERCSDSGYECSCSLGDNHSPYRSNMHCDEGPPQAPCYQGTYDTSTPPKLVAEGMKEELRPIFNDLYQTQMAWLYAQPITYLRERLEAEALQSTKLGSWADTPIEGTSRFVALDPGSNTATNLIGSCFGATDETMTVAEEYETRQATWFDWTHDPDLLSYLTTHVPEAADPATGEPLIGARSDRADYPSTDFYKQNDVLAVSWYYIEGAEPDSGTAQRYNLPTLLFNIEANRAWERKAAAIDHRDEKPIVIYSWLRWLDAGGTFVPDDEDGAVTIHPDANGVDRHIDRKRFIPPHLVEATAIFPFFAGAKMSYPWDLRTDIHAAESWAAYEHFIHGLYRLSLHDDVFTPGWSIVEPRANTIPLAKNGDITAWCAACPECQDPVSLLRCENRPTWRAIVSGDRSRILVAAYNPWPTTQTLTATQLWVSQCATSRWSPPTPIVLAPNEVYLAAFAFDPGAYLPVSDVACPTGLSTCDGCVVAPGSDDPAVCAGPKILQGGLCGGDGEGLTCQAGVCQ